MILQCEAVLASVRAEGNCAWCCKASRTGHDPAHVFARGLGGGHEVTAVWSVVPFCRPCHQRSHASGVPSKADMLAIAAKRCKCSVDDIKAAYNFISNQLDKDDSEERLAQRIMDAVGYHTITPIVAAMVEDALIQAGKLTE